MPKGPPVSVRLSEPTRRLVEMEARRTRRSRSAVIEAIVEEGARIRRFPGIAFRGDDASRRPWVIGTGLDVWQIIEGFQGFDDVGKMLEHSHLTEAQVSLALAYREAYPEEIDKAIAENRPSIDQLAEAYPSISIQTLD